MLEFVNGLLLILSIVSLFVLVFILWFIWLDNRDDNISKSGILITVFALVITIALGYGSFYTDVKLKIINAEATVASFEELRKQYGDNYIVEPETNSKYAEALATLKKYKSLGLYKNDYTSNSINKTETNKYCGCSPCECIGECKCTKDKPFPGYEKIK